MENEKNNKKGLVTLIVGIGILFALIFSATFAYFSVTSTNSFGSSTIDATAESIGTVTLNGTSSNLRLDLSAVDMMKGASDITYWGTSDGTPSTTQNVVTIGNTQVTGAGYFNCNYTLNVTATGTNNMYTAFQGMSGKSTEQIVLKIGNTKYDFNTANLFPITINGALNGVTSSDVKSLTAEFYIVNKEGVNQDALKGTDITITITATNFSCDAVEPPVYLHDHIVELASDSSCSIQKYNGKVTDRYQDYGVGVDATKVYYPKFGTSNNCNNVIFEGFCWKVIRTTETGGTKLLYSGIPSNGTCTSTGLYTMLNNTDQYSKFSNVSLNNSNSPAYIGYMYNKTTGTLREMLYGVTEDEVLNETYGAGVYTSATTVNVTDSYIKKKLETWFSTSGIDENKLESAVYCNDRSLSVYSPYNALDTVYTSGTIYYANYSDGLSYKETLECTYQTDAFSVDNPKAQTNYKVGLMSSPEAKIIDAPSISPCNTTGCLLMSPIQFRSSTATIGVLTYDIVSSDVSYSKGVRPVISLNSGAIITDGEGSTTNPFIVE